MNCVTCFPVPAEAHDNNKITERKQWVWAGPLSSSRCLERMFLAVLRKAVSLATTQPFKYMPFCCVLTSADPRPSAHGWFVFSSMWPHLSNSSLSCSQQYFWSSASIFHASHSQHAPLFCFWNLRPYLWCYTHMTSCCDTGVRVLCLSN